MAKIARVVVSSTAKNIDRFFDYNIPESMGEVLPGMRVFVPFGAGNRPMEGYVVDILSESEYADLKDIKKVIDETPILTKAEIEDALWIRERYICTYAEALKLFLPPGEGFKLEEWISLDPSLNADEVLSSLKGSPLQEKIIIALMENGGTMEFGALKGAIGSNPRPQVKALLERGIISISHTDRARAREKTVRVVRRTMEPEPPNLQKAAPKQARMLKILEEYEQITLSDLCAISRSTQSVADGLIKRGLAEYDDIEVLRSPTAHKGILPDTPPRLTPEQERAVETILRGSGGFLIHGVTGSGKTEVYLRVIEDALKRGKSAIVLVPEISLTPQMSEWFIARFGDRVALLHSAMSMGERYDEWRRIKSGAARVVVGARSAVFAPAKDLGVIIVDEEQEQTYKSEMGPRYHARDVAERRAKSAGAKLILASATPSLESYYRAKRGELTLVELKTRWSGAPLPESELVDMREELAAGNRSVLSRRLKEELQKNMENGQQSILFINRRGFSTFVSCRSCGFVCACPHCSISLTYHRQSNAMVCHYCGYSTGVLTVCPNCGSKYIKFFGTGTQKVEEIIKKELPGASVIRMDLDTTATAHAHERILKRFEKEKIDILLGTQMVTKGLDFPNVTLVGVLAADLSLNALDFRAAERAFSQITQVSGRAGRGEHRGRVIIQTYMPENLTLRLALSQDYGSFFEQEIDVRKVLNFPPFCDIIDIIIIGKNESLVKSAALGMWDEARREMALSGTGAEVFRAMPCGVPRVRGKYRWHFWIKCDLGGPVCEIISRVTEKRQKGISVIIDVNPIAL